MPKFIYSIKEIFDYNTEVGCLKNNEVLGYFIGPYQRGYKWKSQTANDHIPVLLVDLYEAFLKSKEINSKDHEYYLQYITVKRIKHNDNYFFEVIDGQQRLTSLTIMYLVLEKYFQKENHSKKGSEYLVSYSRFEGDGNIFDAILGMMNSESNFDNDIQEQDKFYMLKAARCFKTFFELVHENNIDFDDFFKFINENVKLILNREDETTSSEEVFANLNANKVPLTNSYLIKGLLLTKASRNGSLEISKKHFREILDERAIMGRTWDEMNAWFENDQVRSFFFGKLNDGMEQMLKLIRFDKDENKTEIINRFKDPIKENSNSSGTYDLFNYFHDNLLTSAEASSCLNNVKHLYKRMKSWHENNLSYNLLGYCLETAKDRFKEIESLIMLDSNQEVISFLQNHLFNQLVDSNTELAKLQYGKQKGNEKISRILLALSVFPESEQLCENSNFRFNFFQFQKENWSLEHIFPQNPNLEKFNVAEDKDWAIDKIKKQIGKETDTERVRKYQETLRLIESDMEITTEAISFIFDEIQDVDNLGNMALLSGKVNSSLSNGFFKTKRKILIRKVNSGSFVPKHTMDVFSKMLETGEKDEFNTSIVNWDNDDIIAHRTWIIQRVQQIVSLLNQKQNKEEAIV